MRLQHIKLAGFKSFVDPTVIPFPGQLTGVLGPNGCGKSNVIDAVRWVMGESQAKHLRGESMTDVIFNGSSQRKALGQASVELVFDNSDGRIGGQFGSYREISLRRTVNRDGESAYFLNGTRCRKRDITDLFHGTGASPRGYAIIGQGTISRIVEARPEELRAYLEEAAGVSRYRDRRRETVQRMEKARENLERVVLLRDEMDKQIARLARQVSALERFRTLKGQERESRIRLLLLKRSALLAARQEQQNILQTLQDACQQYETEATCAMADVAVYRQRLDSGMREAHTFQEQGYQLAAEIARLEADRNQRLQEHARLRQEQTRLQVQWEASHAQCLRDEDILQVSGDRLVQLDVAALEATSALEAFRIVLAEAEQAAQSANVDWQQVLVACQQARKDAELAALRAENTTARKREFLQRLEKNREALANPGETGSVGDLAKYQADREQFQALTENLASGVVDGECRLQALREQLESLRAAEVEAEKSCQALRMEHASLCAVQQAALHADSPVAKEACPAFSHLQRLVTMLEVEPAWQKACEQVLREALEAFVTEHPLEEALAQTVPVTLVAPATTPAAPGRFPTLADKMRGCRFHWMYAPDRIYTAENRDEALRLAAGLTGEESVITPDGYWVGIGWIRGPASPVDADDGVLSRQARIAGLEKTLRMVEETHKVQIQARLEGEETLKEATETHRTVCDQLADARASLAVAEAEANRLHQWAKLAADRRERLEAEQTELISGLQALQEEETVLSALLTGAEAAARARAAETAELETRRHAAAMHCEEARHKQEVLRDAVFEATRARDAEKHRHQQALESRNREQGRAEDLQQHLEEIVQSLEAIQLPDDTQDMALREKMRQHEEFGILQQQTLAALDALRQQLADRERDGERYAAEVKRCAQQVTECQLQEQALAGKASHMAESLAELNVDADSAELTEGITEAMCEATLQAVGEQLQKLGAINLAASDEYEAEARRKAGLDEQHADLSAALATLEEAIATLDNETRVRFLDTFQAVNSGFQGLFPRLFGGGRATLILTSDNPLEAGIQVMAQPPGKRNSTIHLLSGGEKAMTAVALVFSIFRLNPSPFCMLDEVDAPLDDMNVGRFCDLVREMSQCVQFLFITHNRVTMELAEHLIGVTMREPGVSRIVAVDVEQAMTLCATNQE